MSSTPFTVLGVHGKLGPGDEARAIGPIVHVFTGGAGQSFTRSFSAEQQQGLLSSAQTMFLDVSQPVGHGVYVQFSSSQRIGLTVGWQGYFPVIAGNPLTYTISSPLGTTGPVTLFFLNFPTDAVVWDAAP